jgi:hypothetical protein
VLEAVIGKREATAVALDKRGDTGVDVLSVEVLLEIVLDFQAGRSVPI